MAPHLRRPRRIGHMIAAYTVVIVTAACAAAEPSTPLPAPVAQPAIEPVASLPAPVAQAAGGPTDAAAAIPAGLGVPEGTTSPAVTGKLRGATTVEADTLLDVAYENDLGFIELIAANPGVDPWLPGEGAAILLPTQHILPDAPHEGVIINLAAMRLYYVPPDGGEVRTYPVGIGRGGLSTPTGRTTINAKVKEPAWYPTERMRKEDPSLPRVMGPGPENPLGNYALDLGWPAYLIHGTNKKWGIGRRVSSGCIRLYPEGIRDLFGRIESGTPVTVVDQPLKFAWIDGDLYLEAHTTQTQAEALEQTGSFEPDPNLDLARRVGDALGERDVAVDWPRLRRVVAERRGIPVRVTKAAPS